MWRVTVDFSSLTTTARCLLFLDTRHVRTAPWLIDTSTPGPLTMVRPPRSCVDAMMGLASGPLSDQDRDELTRQRRRSSHFQWNSLRPEGHEQHDKHTNRWSPYSQHAHEQPLARTYPFCAHARRHRASPLPRDPSSEPLTEVDGRSPLRPVLPGRRTRNVPSSGPKERNLHCAWLPNRRAERDFSIIANFHPRMELCFRGWHWPAFD